MSLHGSRMQPPDHRTACQSGLGECSDAPKRRIWKMPKLGWANTGVKVITNESMARNRFHSITTHAIIFGSANMARPLIGCDAPWPTVFLPKLGFHRSGRLSRTDQSARFKQSSQGDDVWIGYRLDIATFSECPMEWTKI